MTSYCANQFSILNSVNFSLRSSTIEFVGGCKWPYVGWYGTLNQCNEYVRKSQTSTNHLKPMVEFIGFIEHEHIARKSGQLRLQVDLFFFIFIVEALRL